MSCKNHLNPLKNCIKCLNDIADDQAKIIFALMNRADDTWAAFPSNTSRNVLLEIEARYPVTSPIKEKTPHG